MQKALLIAEKPSVMNDIRNAYNKIKGSYPYDIDFGCCAGHLIGLCDPDEYKEEWGGPWNKDVLPMIPETWKKKVIKPDFFKELKELWNSGKYDVVINAGDAGREGQAIQELVYEALGVNVPILRYWADDTTEKTIIKTLNNLEPNENYKGLKDASLLRMYFDWLIGMNFSRGASLSLRRTTRIGRVMTPTLALVVKRENEIQGFKPVPYFELSAGFNTDDGRKYTATLLNKDADDKSPSKYAFLDKAKLEDLKKVLSALDKGTVTEVEEEEKINRAPTFFNLSDLQKECSKRFGFTPSKTLDVAQNLYEKHYLSYPRTESKCLTTEQAKDITSLIKKVGTIPSFTPYTDNILKDTATIDKAIRSKKYFDNSKVSDHPALTPTSDIPNIDSLTADEKKLYTLVLCRFLGVFMPDNITIQTSVITTVSTNGEDYLFKAVGSVEKQTGWKEILKLINTKSSSKPEANSLPRLFKGETVNMSNLKIAEKQTNPPKRYDDATILSAMETAGKQLEDKELEKVLMECAGLGTPATRADILEKLITYGYMERKAKTLFPTEQGMEYVKALGNNLILSPELTAVWEGKLKEVEDEKISYEDFYNAMIKYINSETASMLSLQPIGPYRKIIGKCPKCQRNFVSIEKFYCCEGFFEKKDGNSEERVCDFGLPKTFGKKPLTETDAKQLINGEMTKPKEYIWKNGTKSTTPLILKDFKISFPTASEKRESVGKCPICGGRVVIGKTGYYCEEWNTKKEDGTPNCEFSIYGKIGRTDISSTNIAQILEFGETKKDVKVTWESGKSFSSKLILEQTESGKYRVSMKPFESRDICKCPYCNLGTLREEHYAYECTNNPSKGGSCLARIPKTFSGSSISEEEALTLLTKGELPPKSFISSKTKKSFKAILTTEIDEKKGLIIVPKFLNSKK